MAVGAPAVREFERTFVVGSVLVDELDETEFHVGEMIGRGGMGEVYRATRLSDGAPCAVKCVRRDMLRNTTVLLRTRFESQAFREIRHPNVVRVFGTGMRDDGVPWMAMEWLDGNTIEEMLEKRGPLPLRWAIEIVRDLCRGLEAIHQHAIHRDIKPSNIHFGSDGVTRALDLGAAKSNEPNVHLTSTGFTVGTLPYMAPEQLDNTVPIDHRADLWAATVVLYTLMTGVYPFAEQGKIPQNKVMLGWKILREPHRPLLDLLPSAPPFFGTLIDRGLAKHAAERHRSAHELAEVLTAALAYLEANTGHAEPISSLAKQLAGDAHAIVAAPPQLLWTPKQAPPNRLGPRGTTVIAEEDDDAKQGPVPSGAPMLVAEASDVAEDPTAQMPKAMRRSDRRLKVVARDAANDVARAVDADRSLRTPKRELEPPAPGLGRSIDAAPASMPLPARGARAATPARRARELPAATLPRSRSPQLVWQILAGLLLIGILLVSLRGNWLRREAPYGAASTTTPAEPRAPTATAPSVPSASQGPLPPAETASAPPVVTPAAVVTAPSPNPTTQASAGLPTRRTPTSRPTADRPGGLNGFD